MRKGILVLTMLMLAAPAMAAQHLRLDLSGIGATDGPSPGLAIGADVQIDPRWFWTLRASRLDDDDASAHTFLAGLEYGFPGAKDGPLVPYLAYRVGGRWSSEDTEVCSLALAAAGQGGGDPHPDPVIVQTCHSGEVDSTAFVYQAGAGIDWMAPDSRWGATAEAAYTDTTDSGGEVEFLVGVTFRP